MGCVDVNDTVHMVRLRCICVCDVAHEWVLYPFHVIEMCDSNMYLYRLQSHRVNKQPLITKKNAVAKEINLTV